MGGRIEARLSALGIDLPAAANPVANYVPYLISGDLLFISGQISKADDGTLLSGQLGDSVTVTQGQAAARVCALNILAQAQSALSNLDRVAQVVRLNGFISATPQFRDHPQVINGASDLMVEIFEDRGRHTRAAVGVASLPLGCAVEIDAVFKISTD